ncbi:MAG: hypothetical protein IPJ13_17695 [Saprospiraceae bacterium]|nr:hypothetical protein [Saprospiraceae bacterium]
MPNNKQFDECLDVAHILKFSNDRIKDFTKKHTTQRVPLEIITLGKNGLKYRFSHDLNANTWVDLPSYKISYVMDGAGAGDWFSAGIISKLASGGIKSFNKSNDSNCKKALVYGQSLGP